MAGLEALLGPEPKRPRLSPGSSQGGGLQHLQQPLSASQHSLPSLRSLFLAAAPQQAPSAAAAVPSAPGPALAEEASDEELGPLTQMAATHGGGAVSAAFCPNCGAFLSDMGATEAERQQHVAACQSGSSSEGEARQGGGGNGGADGGDDAGSDGASEVGEGGSEDEGAAQEPEAAQGEASWLSGGWCEEEPGPDSFEGPPGAGGGAAEEDEVVVVSESWEQQEQEQQQAESSGGSSGIQEWLAERGLEKYADCFLRAGADLSLLPFLSDADLKELGVATLGARKKILLGAAELAAGSGGGGFAQQDNTAATAAAAAAGADATRAAEPAAAEAAGAAGAANSGVGDWRALSGAGGAALFCGNIRRYFQPDASKPPRQQPQQQPTGIRQYFQAQGGNGSKPAARPVQAPAAAKAAAPAGRGGGAAGAGRGRQAQWAHKAATGDAAAGGGRRFGRGGRGTAQPVPLKSWQLVPGTAFVVDRFDALPPTLPNRHWFLTHFHADHYKGLSGRFDRGLLYCSPPTARLVQQQLRVAAARIRPHPLNEPFVVEGVKVTFLEANHCPGAVMIMFEPPGLRPVLHTGDCRLISAMQQESALQAVRGRCDLILDTTYCSPEYAFPSQAEVLQFSIDAVKAEAFNPKTLFLFGSYTIGKERLFLEAARVLQRKVYVSATKCKVLDCLDLPPEYASLLTTDDSETNLHAVPLWMVSQKHMAKILKFYRGRFTNVVGFQPTGWTHEREQGSTRRSRGRRRQKGTIITYQVPYSEHSSFSELREFVGWLKPLRIIPHVNADEGGPKARRLVQLLQG